MKSLGQSWYWHPKLGYSLGCGGPPPPQQRPSHLHPPLSMQEVIMEIMGIVEEPGTHTW